MMRTTMATMPGDPDVPNEDWATATSDAIVVLDGATARIETGCSHGIAWYVEQLGSNLVSAVTQSDRPLDTVLAESITSVAALHPQCDLSHPGTPSAGVAIIRLAADVIQYLVLADTTIAIDTSEGLRVFTDDRVHNAAPRERETAMALPYASAERGRALREMKRRQQAVRNKPGGFWVAAANPEAAKHAVTGAMPVSDVTRIAVFTDGAARCVQPFNLMTWHEALSVLDTVGPAELIHRVRAAEAADPTAQRWLRAKRSDDATVVYATLP